jgi:hypothetical protein
VEEADGMIRTREHDPLRQFCRVQMMHALINTPLQWGGHAARARANRFNGLQIWRGQGALETVETVRSWLDPLITPLKWGANETQDRKSVVQGDSEGPARRRAFPNHEKTSLRSRSEYGEASSIPRMAWARESFDQSASSTLACDPFDFRNSTKASTSVCADSGNALTCSTIFSAMLIAEEACISPS